MVKREFAKTPNFLNGMATNEWKSTWKKLKIQHRNNKSIIAHRKISIDFNTQSLYSKAIIK
jgi:hypothetical protein